MAFMCTHYVCLTYGWFVRTVLKAVQMKEIFIQYFDGKTATKQLYKQTTTGNSIYLFVQAYNLIYLELNLYHLQQCVDN